MDRARRLPDIEFDIRFQRILLSFALTPFKSRFAFFLLSSRISRRKHHVAQSLRSLSTSARGGQLHGGRSGVPGNVDDISMSARDFDPLDSRIAMDSSHKSEG